MAAPFGSPEDFGGAITSGVFGYDAGVRAIDMSPMLTDINAKRSAIMSKLGETDVKSVSHNWIRYDVGTIDESDAFPPAADYTYSDPHVPTRVQNVPRLFRKTAQVSGESAKDLHFAAIGDQIDYQETIAMERLVRDMNWAVYNSRLVNTNESTARRTRGIRESLVRAGNFSLVSGALTDALFKNTMLRGVRDDGFKPQMVVTGETQQAVIDGFAYGNTPWIAAEKKTRISHVTEIETPFGTVDVHMEWADYLAKAVDDSALLPVALPANEISGQETYTGNSWIFALALNDGSAPLWQIGWFRRPWKEEPPRDGDRWRGVYHGQFMVIDRAATAGFALTGLT